MATKETIVVEIGALKEDDLEELHRLIRQFLESKRRGTPPTLMSRLKNVQIEAPEDFATNLDLYVSGEKHVQ